MNFDKYEGSLLESIEYHYKKVSYPNILNLMNGIMKQKRYIKKNK